MQYDDINSMYYMVIQIRNITARYSTLLIKIHSAWIYQFRQNLDNWGCIQADIHVLKLKPVSYMWIRHLLS